ncbi:rhodanese family protein [Sphingomonas psychrolutea]|uniref:Membrane protein n=1 Tax=Sphingomonas psychrolutea TaxID=1259676 RepID=A0ABQ1GDP7_9SPHN|nr:rhodanese family protein [Sphingomonas psychrolutea]GGA41715.1 membrane protein [Sphingomonas psychrolutea]
MSKTLIALTPDAVEERVRQGHALLIDIREEDEFARRHIPGAVSRPLSRFEAVALPEMAGTDVIFTCRSGMRTAANADRLAGRIGGKAYVLDGGLDGWARAGLPVAANRKAPLEMMRQVQIFAGSLVLTGVLLGWLVSPYLFGLSAFVGAGLTFAGISGFCGMARLLGYLPWNRSVAA